MKGKGGDGGEPNKIKDHLRGFMGTEYSRNFTI